jgi:hypothetical protein
VRQAARAKGDGKNIVGLELGLRAYGRFLEGPVPRGVGSAVVGGVLLLMAGAAVLYLLGAYVVEALLAF